MVLDGEAGIPRSALQLIERHRVTTTHMVPTQFHRLLLLPEEVRAALRRLVAHATFCTPPPPAPSR